MKKNEGPPHTNEYPYIRMNTLHIRLNWTKKHWGTGKPKCLAARERCQHKARKESTPLRVTPKRNRRPQKVLSSSTPCLKAAVSALRRRRESPKRLAGRERDQHKARSQSQIIRTKHSLTHGLAVCEFGHLPCEHVKGPLESFWDGGLRKKP